MSLCLTPEDFGEAENSQVVEVFPDNLKSVNLFISMCTQWRMGPMGPIGLDYNVLPILWKLFGIKASERSAIFDDLRILEDSALAEMRLR